jgi:hypothetical protein
LRKNAEELLRANFLPYESCFREKGRMMVNKMNFPVKGLIGEIKRITDPHKAKGISHPFPTVLGIAFCAVMFGARVR